MPSIDRIPRQTARTRRAFGGIGMDFVPYEGAIKSVDIGAFNFNTTGVVTAGSVVIADGGTVGQAAGPLMTFDDTNNFLGITGCHVGIGEQGAADYTTTNLHISSDWSTQLRLTRYSAAAGGGANAKMRRARGTLAAPGYVIDGDAVAYLDIYGWARNAADTADVFVQLGKFDFAVDGVDAQDRVGGKFNIELSPGVSAAPVSVLQITADGNMILPTDGDFTTGGLGTFGNLDVDTLNLNGNVISDSTGTISFDNENLTTTGLGTFGSLDVDTLNLDGNIISDSTGTISFADEALTTTGLITGAAFNATDETNAFRIDGAKIIAIPGTENLCVGPNISAAITGNRNTLLGPYAGGSLTGGSSETLIGWAAGYLTTDGSDNTCIGRDTGRSITTGGRGVYIGAYAGRDLPTTSEKNICIGYTAGYGAAANVANGNIFIGYEAGYGIRTGYYNVGIGTEALQSVTTGLNNIGIGQQAGHGQTTGSDNFYFGTQAGLTAHTFSGTLVLGHYANATANYQMVVGSATSPIISMYLGEGVLSATPQDLLFSATGGSGTDIAAGDLIIAGGKGTGDADPGDILFQTSTAGAAGATLQTLTTRMEVTPEAVNMRADEVFIGAGTGLPYGELYYHGAGQDVVCTTQNTWYQVPMDTVGLSNLTTLSAANNDITIQKTGVYQIRFHSNCRSATANDFEITMFKNNGATELVPCDVHLTTIAGAKVVAQSAGALISLTANDTLEIWVRCTDAAGKTLTFEHVSFNCTMIGG